MSNDTKADVWLPLVVGDYLKHTSRLTTEQHGAYLLLLMDYWTNGPPPDDDIALAAICGLDARRWRLNRPVIQRYFRVTDGVWRNKRSDEELERWAEKKRRFVERAAAGGRGKAAKSTQQAGKNGPNSLLEGCTSSSSREVEGPSGHSTLSGQNDFNGPKEVRDAFVAKLGEGWVHDYLDPCGWQDMPQRSLVPATDYARKKIIRDGRSVVAELELTVLEKAA